jgi:hypothetical protein
VSSAPNPVEAASAAKQRPQSAVLVILAEGTRARQARTATIRTRRSLPHRLRHPVPIQPRGRADVRRRLAKIGTLQNRRCAAGEAAGAIDRYRGKFRAGRRRAPAPSRAQGGTAAGHGLKSGVVDGMAYSLYSDGSIEAQMPEGMMRFASIDELRAHLDQRP